MCSFWVSSVDWRLNVRAGTLTCVLLLMRSVLCCDSTCRGGYQDGVYVRFYRVLVLLCVFLFLVIIRYIVKTEGQQRKIQFAYCVSSCVCCAFAIVWLGIVRVHV